MTPSSFDSAINPVLSGAYPDNDYRIFYCHRDFRQLVTGHYVVLSFIL